MIGQLNYQTAAYTARYIMKKVGGEMAETHYQRTNPDTGEIYQLKPEFATMSKKPGLGSGWYDRYKTDAFPSDFLVFQGKKTTVPKYYLDKLERESLLEHKAVKAKRRTALSKHKANNTPERLAVRKEVKLSQIKTLSRNL